MSGERERTEKGVPKIIHTSGACSKADRRRDRAVALGQDGTVAGDG